MPRRSNEFQRLIAFIEAQLAPEGAQVTESVLVPTLDDSGEREVDVLIEGMVGGHEVRIAVECRDHRRRQSVTWIDQLDGTYRNLPIDKVIAVSRSGFTKPATARAKRVGIVTYSLEEALAADWPHEFTRWKAGLIVWRYYLAGARVVYSSAAPATMTEQELKAAVVQAQDGQGRSTFEEDVRKLHRENAQQAVIEATAENLDTWVKEGTGKEWEITVSFNAHNRFLIGPDGRDFAIKELILVIQCKYEVKSADHRHFTYRGTRVTTAVIPFDAHRDAHFTMLHDDAGKPGKVNVRLAPSRRGKRC